MLVVTYWSDTLGWRSDIPSNSSPLVDFCSFLTLCSFSSSWCFFPDCRGKTAVPTLRHTGVDFWLWNYGDRSRTWSEERHVMWRHAGFCLFVCLWLLGRSYISLPLAGFLAQCWPSVLTGGWEKKDLSFSWTGWKMRANNVRRQKLLRYKSKRS